MGLVAYLYRDTRWAERHTVERDATLRDSDWSPIDVTVEDLSESGFSVTAPTELAIGTEIGLGLSGIGMREARVVRRTEYLYGCEFLAALTVQELRAALATPPMTPIALPLETGAIGEAEEHPERLPLGMRSVAIVAGAILAWAVVIGLGWILVGLVRSILSA
ncbi:PilZ domain-containing protein [Sphingomonas sp. JC676]|uniref:PilZ domain-containing protein n=1 Tax=Sphingomonas sp. JC676 TaxID=2768065 RepID=UPI001657F733|nr:PilZ domain-containing protein [Sphingomonas sp. JC676]MBC9033461.1 PilZ domain-containing protein [Sphingomonas sp. JC676]